MNTPTTRSIGYAALIVGFAAYGLLQLPTSSSPQNDQPQVAGGADASSGEQPDASQGDATFGDAAAAADAKTTELPPAATTEAPDDSTLEDSVASLPPRLRTQDTPLDGALGNSVGSAYLLQGKELDLPVFRVDGFKAMPSTFGKELLPPPTNATRSDARARVAVVNFWATWCTPCVKEMPQVKAFMDREFPPAAKVAFVAVHAMQEGEGLWSAKEYAGMLATRAEGSLPPWRDRLPAHAHFLYEASLSDAKSKFLNRLADRRTALANLPVTLLVDCHRRVRFVHNGAMTEAFLQTKLKPAIEALLAESAADGSCPVSGDGHCSAPSEKCVKGMKDCYEQLCHHNDQCEDFAQERYEDPRFFAVCRHLIKPESCHAEFNPTTHPWCHGDGKCTDPAEKEEAKRGDGIHVER